MAVPVCARFDTVRSAKADRVGQRTTCESELGTKRDKQARDLDMCVMRGSGNPAMFRASIDRSSQNISVEMDNPSFLELLELLSTVWTLWNLLCWERWLG